VRGWSVSRTWWALQSYYDCPVSRSKDEVSKDFELPQHNSSLFRLLLACAAGERTVSSLLKLCTAKTVRRRPSVAVSLIMPHDRPIGLREDLVVHRSVHRGSGPSGFVHRLICAGLGIPCLADWLARNEPPDAKHNNCENEAELLSSRALIRCRHPPCSCNDVKHANTSLCQCLLVIAHVRALHGRVEVCGGTLHGYGHSVHPCDTVANDATVVPENHTKKALSFSAARLQIFKSKITSVLCSSRLSWQTETTSLFTTRYEPQMQTNNHDYRACTMNKTVSAFINVNSLLSVRHVMSSCSSYTSGRGSAVRTTPSLAPR